MRQRETPYTHLTDHDLDDLSGTRAYPNLGFKICCARICAVQIQQGKHMQGHIQGHADFAAPTRKHDLPGISYRPGMPERPRC